MMCILAEANVTAGICKIIVLYGRALDISLKENTKGDRVVVTQATGKVLRTDRICLMQATGVVTCTRPGLRHWRTSAHYGYGSASAQGNKS